MAAVTASLPPAQHTFESTISFSVPVISDASDRSTSNRAVPDSTSDEDSIVERVSSPPKPTTSSNGVGFSFVNVAHPSDARGSLSKRAIRSHVARVQHSKTRASFVNKRTAKAKIAARTLQPRLPGVEIANVGRKRSHPDHPPLLPQDSSEESVEEIHVLRPNKLESLSRHDSHSSESSRHKVSDDSTSNSDHSQSPMDGDHSPSLSLYLRDGRRDPFWTYPIPQNRDLERVIDHYLVHIAVDMSFLTPPSQPNTIKTLWYPLALTEPAMFYACILMATSHFLFLNTHLKTPVNVLTLKSTAISHINAALADPTRATSDAILGAVMKLASYEAIFGDPAAYEAHMAGLARLVSLRGGMRNLGLHGLLERILLWIDANAASQLGGTWKIDWSWYPSRGLTHPAVDPANFARVVA